ncbi:MAG TPA: aminoacyl-tRNA hydrolase [Nannocystis exedens]|nr:aminoacyl-tRNA hydrolase [Nannocystis exedens]
MRWRATRSSGPGGQNVNKVASKVELRVSLGDIEGLGEQALDRLRRLGQRFITTGDELIITSTLTRDQARNLADAHGKLLTLLDLAGRRPRQRRKTKPSRAAKARRLTAKRHTSEKKRNRQKTSDD